MPLSAKYQGLLEIEYTSFAVAVVVVVAVHSADSEFGLDLP